MTPSAWCSFLKKLFCLRSNRRRKVSVERVKALGFSRWNIKCLRSLCEVSKIMPIFWHLSEDKIAPIFKTILSNTHEYLAKFQYRSTQRTANLVKLQNYQKRSLAGTKVGIDGQDYSWRIWLTSTLDQLQWGFELNTTHPYHCFKCKVHGAPWVGPLR